MTRTNGTGENAVRGGPVVLDIGGDIGALAVTVHDSLAGTEIDISPMETGGRARTHTGVHPRETPRGTRQIAVYPALVSGDYQLWHPHDDSLLATAHIDGGQLTQLDLTDVAQARPHTHHEHQHAHQH